MEEMNEANDMIISTNEEIKDLIYTIRGKQVMLDSDVARLYHYETKKINQTVKRNIARFPENFCFQLTEKELKNLRSQFATSSFQPQFLLVENKNFQEIFLDFFLLFHLFFLFHNDIT